MSNFIDLRSRLGHEGPCASPADLLLSKMQIYEVNRKDMVDLTALLLDHPIKPQDDEAIDPTDVARLAAEDWGIYRTRQSNGGKLSHSGDELDIDRELG